MARTSNKRTEILEFITAFVSERGYSPSVREIMDGVHLKSTSTVHYHVSELIRSGAISSVENQNRSISIPKGKGIPILGVVTAGQPILAVENIEGYLPWDDDSNCFALRVRGDSMINAGILDGDKVVVRPQQTAHHGEIVVALLEDSATVKRLSLTDGVWLLPENPNYDPIDGREAQIIGLVKAVIREY